MRGLHLAAVLSIVFVLAACGTENAPTADVQSNPAQVQANNDPANAGFVARVNTVGIAVDHYNRVLARLAATSNAADDTALARQVLDTLIEQELINQAAPSLGVNVTDDQVATEMANLRAIARTEEEWQQYLTLNGYTEAEMSDAQRELLVTQGVRDQLMAQYLGDVPQVNARHIVVRTLDEANDLLSRLANGEGFATLAAQYSLDSTTRDTGGNLGWFTRNELFYPELEEVAFALEPGQSAGPIPTSLGYHIIQTLDKQTRPIEPERLPMLSENIFNNWLSQLYNTAQIERYVP